MLDMNFEFRTRFRSLANTFGDPDTSRPQAVACICQRLHHYPVDIAYSRVMCWIPYQYRTLHVRKC